MSNQAELDPNYKPLPNNADRFEYKVISIGYINNHTWKQSLESRLNELAEIGWLPILNGDGGNSYTVICQRPKR